MLETEFHPWTRGKWMLRCVDIRPETHDVKTFSFRTEHNGKPVLFLHKPGQFVTIRLAHEGQLVPRSYTIASSPSQPFTLQMTTKRDPNGLVSRFMHDHFSVGDLLPVYGPGGHFNFFDVKPRKDVLMLSGGSGITPLMSMLRYLSDTCDRDHRITFLHAARTPDDIIFRKELELIAARTGTTRAPSNAKIPPTTNVHRHPTVRVNAGTATPPRSRANGSADCLTAKARP